MERRVKLPAGEEVPALGQGTWKMAEDRAPRADELAALRLGIELGMTLIDTAEMYGEGKTEELVGEAIVGLRDRVFLVSKVYPHNASRVGVAQACERSLRRLKTDRLDLYLLHWPGSVPIAETVEGFEALKRVGKIRHWGVSKELFEVPGGRACATKQILYNLSRRGPEYDLLPWMEERGLPTTAYSPIEQGRLRRSGALDEIGRKHGATLYQIALAWVMRRPDVIAIPKGGPRRARPREPHGGRHRAGRARPLRHRRRLRAAETQEAAGDDLIRPARAESSGRGCGPRARACRSLRSPRPDRERGLLEHGWYACASPNRLW
jgi:diketogulonate reductase-like aldo/keto reductase